MTQIYQRKAVQEILHIMIPQYIPGIMRTVRAKVTFRCGRQ